MFSVVVLVMAVISGAVGLAPCNMEIVNKLKTAQHCYTCGKPPASLTAIGVLGTHVDITPGELPSNTKCVTAIQRAGSATVTIFDQKGGNQTYTMQHQPINAGGYILETDPAGKKYRLYVIHNEAKVYSYYRCIEGTTGGNNIPVGDIAVACKKEANSDAIISKAKACFQELNINVQPLTPCAC